jgi:hypothetical protein
MKIARALETIDRAGVKRSRLASSRTVGLPRSAKTPRGPDRRVKKCDPFNPPCMG